MNKRDTSIKVQRECLLGIYHVADIVLGDWIVLLHLILTIWKVSSSHFADEETEVQGKLAQGHTALF